MTSGNNGKYEKFLKLFVVFISFLAVAFIMAYYWLLIEKQSSGNSEMITELIKSYYDREGPSDSGEERFRKITELLTAADKPFIVTVIAGRNEIPFIWNLPSAGEPGTVELKNELLKAKFSHIDYSGGSSRKRLYFVADDLASRMKFYPFILALTFIFITTMAFFLFYYIRRNEKQAIWIAFSKEAAHQLGTPLTSLKGWRDFLSAVSKECPDVFSAAEGITEDIGKISVVVDRFASISSDKEFKMCDTSEIITRAADYISRRLPSDPDGVVLEKDIGAVRNIYANEILLEWTVENLLKNALESLTKDRKGRIIIKQYEDKNSIIIEVADNGCGIHPSIRKDVFNTGFTTKKRGWGLGLSMSRKIIEQYHGGRLFIKHTGPEGTEMRIELKKYI